MRFESLRRQLTLALFFPLFLFALWDVWSTHQEAQEAATAVQDHMLLSAARMMGRHISTDASQIRADSPPVALELLDAPGDDHVFYRISDARGNLLAGYDELQVPELNFAPEQMHSAMSFVAGAPVRVITYAQPLLAGEPVLIQVAQTLLAQQQQFKTLWWSALQRQLVFVVLWGVLLIFHQHLKRLARHIQSQGRFMADAAHQLRTPLALLNTQVVYALRHAQADVRQEALDAMHTTVQHSAHLVKQLLSFTRFESLTAKQLAWVSTDVRAVVQDVLESFALSAQKAHIDLGYDGTDQAVWCQSDPVLLREMLSNLVDNALRYTPTSGVVTVGVTQKQGRPIIFVQDNGPGIAPAERERVFERFYRLDPTTAGSGLGLSIVREIAQNLKISLELTQPSTGSGLIVRLIF